MEFRLLIKLLQLCKSFFSIIFGFQLVANVYVYGPLRGLARTFPSKKLLREIRRIFQSSTDQAMAYILCCTAFFYSIGMQKSTIAFLSGCSLKLL